jgi:hypothetical protein
MRKRFMGQHCGEEREPTELDYCDRSKVSRRQFGMSGQQSAVSIQQSIVILSADFSPSRRICGCSGAVEPQILRLRARPTRTVTPTSAKAALVGDPEKQRVGESLRALRSG